MVRGGHAIYDLKRYEEARTAYDQAISLDPKDATLSPRHFFCDRKVYLESEREAPSIRLFLEG